MATADSNGAGNVSVPADFSDYLASIGATLCAGDCVRCGGRAHWRADTEALCEACLHQRHGYEQASAYVASLLADLLAAL